MSHRTPRAVAIWACLLLGAACSPSDGGTTSGDASPSTVPSFNAIDQPAVEMTAIPCTPVDGTVADYEGWVSGGDERAEAIPLIVSSLVSAEPSRLLFNVTDEDYRVLAAPEVDATVVFYALDRDPETPVATVEGRYLDTGLGRGLYRATVEFTCTGVWGADVSVTLADGSRLGGRMRFTVHPVGTTPAIGQPAPRSQSPTASSIEEIRRISTDPNPFPGAYERTVAEVVTAGQPSLVFFATPAFCQTGYCGPTVNLVKSVAIDYQDEVGYVNVEPYELQMTDVGLQPRLDADGRLIPVQAVLDYGIPVEPYLFLVDAEGDVFAKFEGVVGSDELRAAIEDVLAEAA